MVTVLEDFGNFLRFFCQNLCNTHTFKKIIIKYIIHERRPTGVRQCIGYWRRQLVALSVGSTWEVGRERCQTHELMSSAIHVPPHRLPPTALPCILSDINLHTTSLPHHSNPSTTFVRSSSPITTMNISALKC